MQVIDDLEEQFQWVVDESLFGVSLKDEKRKWNMYK